MRSRLCAPVQGNHVIQSITRLGLAAMQASNWLQPSIHSRWICLGLSGGTVKSLPLIFVCARPTPARSCCAVRRYTEHKHLIMLEEGSLYLLAVHRYEAPAAQVVRQGLA